MLSLREAVWGLLGVAAIMAGTITESSEAARRVAIADGVATEIAFALGAGDQVVGVDQTSRFPPAAQEKPQLGYFRRLSAEGVLSQSPDVLLASPYAGPETALSQIEAAGVVLKIMPKVDNLNEIATKVRAIGEALALGDEATKLAQRIDAQVAALRSEAPEWPVPPRVLFVLTVRDGAPLVAGSDTPSDEVIRAAGAINVASFEGFKPMSREAIIAAAPDLVLMTDEHSIALAGVAQVLERPEFALTPAGRNNRSLTLPALAVLALGPRSPAAVKALRQALAP